jgi:hypothetical protein
MTRGPAGFGRYDDDPDYVGCPWAKSDMTPCIARDGYMALSSGDMQVCTGCGHTPLHQLEDLAEEYPPAAECQERNPWLLAKRFKQLVRAATEPVQGPHP